MNSLKKSDISPQEELDFKNIDNFLTRQRRDIIRVLYNSSSRLSHSELADAIESTPTSLWNACRQFEQFTPKLIETEISGRYKLYQLTDIARRYMEYKKLQEAAQVGEKRRSIGLQVVSDRSEEYHQQVREAIASIQEQHGERWEVELDNFFLEEQLKTSIYIQPETRASICKLVEAFKKLIMEDDQRVYDEILRDCLSNSILQLRMENHLRLFYCFRKLFAYFEDKKKFWDVYHCLDVIFEKKSEEGEYKRLGLSKKEYDRLRDVLLEFALKEKGKELPQICGDIDNILDTDINIALHIARKIEDYHNRIQGT